MIVETKRLVLRAANPNDASFYYELLTGETWLKYIGDRNLNSVADAKKHLEEKIINSYKVNGFGLYVMELKSNHTAIGICGIVNRPSLEFPDLGFAVLEKYEGLGYTTEAALATMNYANTELKLDTILGITLEENYGSRRVLERAGLSLQEKLPKSEKNEVLLLYSNK